MSGDKGLFGIAIGGPSKPGKGMPTEPGYDGDDEDDSGDMAPPGDDDASDDPGGGPFDAYADTVLDDKADPEDRKDALRQAIMTLIEEQGSGGKGSPF